MPGLRREKIYKQGLADPRSGPERLAGMVHRVLSGNRKSPVRKYDDDPMTMRRNKLKKPPGY